MKTKKIKKIGEFRNNLWNNLISSYRFSSKVSIETTNVIIKRAEELKEKTYSS